MQENFQREVCGYKQKQKTETCSRFMHATNMRLGWSQSSEEITETA